MTSSQSLSDRVLELLFIIVLKMASLILMGYVMLFLTVFGGLADVGVYSAVTAVTAPAAMFFMFRYVEWIALSEDKVSAFSVSVSVAVTGFLLAAPIIYLFLKEVVPSKFFLFFLIAYKPFELLNDFFVSMLVSRGDKRLAFFSLFYKLAGVIIISMTGLMLGFKNLPLLIALALFLAFFGVTLIHDLVCVVRLRIFQWPGSKAMLAYACDNVKFGVLGLLVSVNSLLPRYYLIAMGDMAMLGLFSLAYQIAASMVNILQYPIGLKVAGIRDFFIVRAPWLDFILIGFFALLVASVVGVFFVASGAHIDYATLPRMIFLSIIVLLMFFYLIFRGFLLSLIVATAQTEYIYLVVLISSFVAVLASALVIHLYSEISPFLVSSFFVIVSSFVTSTILVLRFRAGVRR